MSDTGKRINELEEKIAFQEDVIQKLDDALASQQQQLLVAERKIHLMMEQLKKLEVDRPEQASEQDERPPHY